VGLLKTLKEALTVLDYLIGCLGLDTLKVLEFAGESKREGDEVYRLSPSLNELFADEVDLQETLAQIINQRLGIVEIPADTLTAHLGLERQAMIGQRSTDEPQRKRLRTRIELLVALQDSGCPGKMLQGITIQFSVDLENALFVSQAIRSGFALLPAPTINGKILVW
jgi:hypothetical protein